MSKELHRLQQLSGIKMITENFDPYTKYQYDGTKRLAMVKVVPVSQEESSNQEALAAVQAAGADASTMTPTYEAGDIQVIHASGEQLRSDFEQTTGAAGGFTINDGNLSFQAFPDVRLYRLKSDGSVWTGDERVGDLVD